MYRSSPPARLVPSLNILFCFVFPVLLEKAAKLQEEVQAVATQMSAAEDGRRELACQVSDLKCEVREWMDAKVV